jgi:predicted ATPase
MPLLEREHHLAALTEYREEARLGNGRVVIVCGEAGAGKSELLDAFKTDTRHARWATGVCDGLFTPLPLRPLFDIADISRESCSKPAGEARVGTSCSPLCSARWARLES